MHRTDWLRGLALALVVAGLALGAKVEAWRQESAAALAKGKKDGVVVSDAGRVRLARRLEPAGTLEAAHVWALARGKDGSLYAATGDEGKVYRRADAQAEWTVAYDGEDTQILSLVALPDGHVLAGTGPGGRVVDVTDPKHPASQPGPGVQYVWGLAADGEGRVYAATGPEGGLYRRSADGRWSRVLDSKAAHLLCVAVGGDGAVFAGSDGEGLIYRVDAAGKASVLYDAPQSEVRTLLVAPDGALYAGTAADAGGGPGGGPSRGLSSRDDADAPSGGDRVRVAAFEPPQAKAAQGRPADNGGGTVAPRPSAGENAVYRIGPDGAPREVFRARVLVFALAWQGDRLLVGTGPDGVLYEVRDRGRETAPLARLDNGQVLALLAGPDGAVSVGTGEPGGVRSLSAEFVGAGTLTSDVLDAKLVSRFGALSTGAETPAGTALAVEVRTGNVGEPDETWSAWVRPQADADRIAHPDVPPGRFAQYRAVLTTDDPAATPELRGVSWLYQTANLPPEIKQVNVPDLSAADGATRQTRLTIKWDATDPNEDELQFRLAVRKDGWPDWIALGGEPLTGKSFDWDTTALPAGTYRLRLTASDRTSNGTDAALESAFTTEPFVVDHLAPAVAVSFKDGVATATLADDQTRLVKAEYALDGGAWAPVFPADGLFDTRRESLTLALPGLAAGPHVLMVRATDAAGNVGAGDVVFSSP